MNKDWIHKYFTADELLEIKGEIGRVEHTTSGEIRLSLHEKLSFWQKLYKPHELAVKEFDELKMWDTKERTGVLIFIMFEARYYDILADESIFEKIPDSVWNNLEDKLVEEFRAKNYAAGVLNIIKEIGKVLEKEFPRDADDANELEDDIVIN